MKKLLLLLFIAAATTLSACKKGTVLSTEAQVEEAQIQAYIKDNNLTNMSKDASGVYFKIIKPGNTAYPNPSSAVQVTYTGKLLDGTTFDSANATSISLASAIVGWQEGVPHVSTGGRILLIVPSSLAYGNKTTTSIPANSVLIFTIDLLGWQ